MRLRQHNSPTNCELIVKLLVTKNKHQPTDGGGNAPNRGAILNSDTHLCSLLTNASSNTLTNRTHQSVWFYKMSKVKDASLVSL